MLESRETSDVAEWLKTYPNLKVISRDGSAGYAAAINEAHVDAVQVSDRFHLFKNLTDYCKKYITKLVGIKVEIPISNIDRSLALTNNSGYNAKSKQDRIHQVKELYLNGYTKYEITKQLRMDIRTVEKYIGLKDNSEDFKDQDAPLKEHEVSVSKKAANIAKVQELHKQQYTNRAISKETGLSRRTVKRYLDKNVSPTHALYGKRKGGPLKPFHEEINQLLSKGWTFRKVEEAIRKKGYTGSSSAIRMYTTRERRLAKQFKTGLKETELVERQLLVKLLYKPIDKIPRLTSTQLNEVLIIYPKLQAIYNILNSFKELVYSRKPDKLDEWIVEAQALEIDDINSFVTGISRDIEAVKNAIKYEYNNGLAEGSVNKLKVIKRIMYGRNSFDMLRKKVLRLEKKRKIN